MNSRNLLIIGLIFTLGLVLGCSAGSDPVGVNPDAPVINQAANVTGNRVTWGLWDVSINAATGSVDINPLRTANFTANVNNLLEGSPGNLLIEDIDTTDYFTEGRIDCTVTLKHPFPGLNKYNGFDVWGVFMHNGNASLKYDLLKYGADFLAGDNIAVHLNPDGWTRWFNYTEFSGSGSPILEYWPGKLSNLPNPSATLNPYKIFADDLDVEKDYYTWITSSGNADNRGWFTAGASNSRRYEIKFPIIDDAPVLEFQYAVVATWEPGDPTLTGNPSVYDPHDFPTAGEL